MAFQLPPVVRSMRPEQWLKNGFVLAPVVFSGRTLELAAWLVAGVAAAAFCAAASATYMLNDVIDRDADRAHPEKRARPVASGELKAVTAVVIALLLLGVAAAMAAWVGGDFGLTLAAYFGLTVLYSVVLKRMVFVDVLVVAAGFVLRVVGGAVAIEVPASSWLLLCAYLLALYLALGKRRAELVLLGAEADVHRAVLGHYTLPLVDQAISVVLGATVVAYTLYTMAPETVAKVGSEGLMATVPVVLYGLLRYLYLLHRHELGGSPTRAVLVDRPLLICVALWIAIAALVISL